ncbi:MAG: hypothetical protein K0Q51_25 [Rickettsiaceae bacterium]|jgi:hypothetical protein|nr:hypothetical protein [Rickettsiaceae bacterium]
MFKTSGTSFDASPKLEHKSYKLGQSNYFADKVRFALLLNLGAFEYALRCIEGGADVSERNDSGATALHYAAFYSYSHGGPIIELLLKHGADILAEANFNGIIKRPVDNFSLNWLQQKEQWLETANYQAKDDQNIIKELWKAISYLKYSPLEKIGEGDKAQIEMIYSSYSRIFKDKGIIVEGKQPSVIIEGNIYAKQTGEEEIMSSKNAQDFEEKLLGESFIFD